MSEQQGQFTPLTPQSWLHVLEPRKPSSFQLPLPETGLWFVRNGAQFCAWHTTHGVWLGTRYGGTVEDLQEFEAFMQATHAPADPTEERMRSLEAALKPFAQHWELWNQSESTLPFPMWDRRVRGLRDEFWQAAAAVIAAGNGGGE